MNRRLRAIHTSAHVLSPAAGKKPTPRYNFNTGLEWEHEAQDTREESARFRRVTAREVKGRREEGRRVRMLVRDWVDDSLYNQHYGYFSKQATIFSSSPTPTSPGIDIPHHPNLTSFQEAIAEAYERSYGADEGAGDAVALSGKGGKGGLGRQVWHTPTELFRPHYSRIVARALLSHYKLHHYPYTDLQIYEIGAGNGSLMVDIMTFLREEHPEVYERTRYEIIEISGPLAERQRARAEEAGLEVELVAGKRREGRSGAQVRIQNVDFFEWQGSSRDACYFVALEVFDNFAHDMIRYDMDTLEPLQAVVSIDATGDYSLLYEPVTDPAIRRYLGYRRLIYTSLPFAPNLSAPEFIPTKQMMFLEKLRETLPFHRLLVSDFDALPDAVPGRNGPVVQTRYNGEMVPCETFLVKPGYFDIFFPTDLIGVRGFKHRHVGVYDHAEFLTHFGGDEELAGTTTKDGDNVMLSMYKNVKFMF
ncbi:hypothetical protein QFC20_001680 [Naganishia adeliensis]|uniref:Uncharacterized protein n=1 Tax=Naganishia adeliensis TaxID=92952 RepID=A0ACC2WSL7_9TREE|nr:hypothetical protein QFC20_001680 [Naganishia adeliensis]